MKLTQVKGNTWVIEANQLIPLYKLDERRCVLLDTGLAEEREELEELALELALCSYADKLACRRILALLNEGEGPAEKKTKKNRKEK